MSNIHAMPQQAMPGQPGGQSQQPRPQGLPNMQLPQNQQKPIQPREFPVTYHGFSLRKAPAEPGERLSWDRIKPQPFTVSPKEFNSENKTARTQISPYKVYERLRTDSQREAIDRLINTFKSTELNPNAVWEIAYIKANRAPVPGTWGHAVETTDIRVIFKRSPLPHGQQPNLQVAQLQFGKIIDTTIDEPVPVPSQKNQQQQQGQGKTPQQQQQQQHLQQQQQMQQQHPGQFAMPPPMGLGGQPPPPPIMPPPFGNQLPPHPMQGHPPPGAMQGNRANPNGNAPVTQIFNLAQPEKPKKQKSTKAKSARERSMSPRTRQQFRESMDAFEKVKTWKHKNSSSDSSGSESDSGSSVVANQGHGHRSKNKYKDGYKVPPPPMGHYASGALPPRRSMSRSPPILKREMSLKDIRSKNKRLTERKVTERYRSPNTSSGDDSYDFADAPVPHRHRHETPPTSVDSESTRSSHRGSREYKSRTRYSQRERSRSRNRYDRAPRHSRSRSLSRNRYDLDRSRYDFDRRSSIREHRQPDAYRGLSPPPAPQKPIVLHIHNNNTDGVTSVPQHQTALRHNGLPSPEPSLSGLSLEDYSYTGVPVTRALSYPTNDNYSVLPRAPITPTYETIKAQAALEHMRSTRRRETFADIESLERQRAADLYRRRDELLVDKLRRERDRAVPVSAPLRNDYARRPERGYARDNDFTFRNNDDWNRPTVPRRNSGVRFGGGGFDTRDNFQFSRTTY